MLHGSQYSFAPLTRHMPVLSFGGIIAMVPLCTSARFSFFGGILAASDLISASLTFSL